MPQFYRAPAALLRTPAGPGLSAPLRVVGWLALGGAAALAHGADVASQEAAQSGGVVTAERPPGSTPDPGAAAEAAPASAAGEGLKPATRQEAPLRWEGALGINLQDRPEYEGAGRRIFKASPGFFFRYGRLTVTNSSGFRTRRAEDVAQGAALSLVSSSRVRMNLALRIDRGRDEGSSDAYRGLGDVKPTLRLQANAEWQFQPPWRLSLSWTVDALGRGGGHGGDLNLGWEQRVLPGTVLSTHGGVALAGARYMQAYYGVTAEQSTNSGYPAFKPGAGVRNVHAGLDLRTDLNNEWLWLNSVGVSRVVGAAADSPLTHRRGGWSASSGLAWRF